MRRFALILALSASLSLAPSGTAHSQPQGGDVIQNPVCGPADKVRDWLLESQLEEIFMGQITANAIASLWRSEDRFAFYSQHVNGVGCLHILGGPNWFIGVQKNSIKKQRIEYDVKMKSLPGGMKFVWVGMTIPF